MLLVHPRMGTQLVICIRDREHVECTNWDLGGESCCTSKWRWALCPILARDGGVLQYRGIVLTSAPPRSDGVRDSVFEESVWDE